MLNLLNENLFGPLLIVTITCSGIFLMGYLSFKPFRKPKKLFGALKGKEGFKSACLSLSGTLGVGNISGVSAAIITGGAGAVFWMWVFAFIAMIIKYSEILLAGYYKGGKYCGTAYYIEKGLGNRKFAVLFSVLILFSSFGMGNIIQSSAASQSMNYCFGVPKIVTGVLFSIITLLMVIGGRKRVSAFSSAIIPMLSLGYIVVSVAIIMSNIDVIPSVIKEIVFNAFNVRSAAGGILGVLLSDSVRLGAARGILSNEAGCGTSTYAQNVDSDDCVKHAIWGIFEVFADTIILCTMTAFVVLCVPNNLTDGMSSVIYSYSYFGDFGGYFVGISSWIYALASVVCWSYYGTAALNYLTSKKSACGLYLILYSTAGIIGSVFAPDLVWEISDITVSVMAIFNTVCVILLSRTVRSETDRYFS